MAADTKSRMISAAIGLLQRHGLAAMSFTDVLAESGAARGAIYHHFPGGKQQLALEAARRNAEDVRGHLRELPGRTSRDVVDAFLDSVRPVVQASAGGGGCAIAAVTVDGGAAIADQSSLLTVAAEAFTGWGGELAAKLTDTGMSTSQAADLATLMIVTLEGAHILCRAEGSIAPFDRAAAALLSGLPGPG
ncbi:TetR/AcrR family transcriptional regulator [Streptomyces humidus]|uniref:TetR/AcrR family transcriptional regulator n=1 Tax=Streptomyces humidus TaxID=52259 RepID=UPI00167CFCAA|nr:TetR/AcrR family transcriptional regulator [Streptomyces humidus]